MRFRTKHRFTGSRVAEFLFLNEFFRQNLRARPLLKSGLSSGLLADRHTRRSNWRNSTSTWSLWYGQATSCNPKHMFNYKSTKFRSNPVALECSLALFWWSAFIRLVQTLEPLIYTFLAVRDKGRSCISYQLYVSRDCTACHGSYRCQVSANHLNIAKFEKSEKPLNRAKKVTTPFKWAFGFVSQD